MTEESLETSRYDGRIRHCKTLSLVENTRAGVNMPRCDLWACRDTIFDNPVQTRISGHHRVPSPSDKCKSDLCFCLGLFVVEWSKTRLQCKTFI